MLSDDAKTEADAALANKVMCKSIDLASYHRTHRRDPENGANI